MRGSLGASEQRCTLGSFRISSISILCEGVVACSLVYSWCLDIFSSRQLNHPSPKTQQILISY